MAKKMFLLKWLFCAMSVLSISSYAAPLQNPSPLINYPLSKLQMVGTINNGDQIWGIVRTPDNHVYSVTVDSVIGNAHGRILQVTSERITVEDNAAPGQMDIETLWLNND